MALKPSNSSNLEQLALKGLIFVVKKPVNSDVDVSTPQYITSTSQELQVNVQEQVPGSQAQVRLYEYLDLMVKNKPSTRVQQLACDQA